MRRFSLTLKCLSLILALAFVSARISTVSHAVFVEPCQQYLSQKAFIADGDIKPTAQAFKQKRLPVDAPVLVEVDTPEFRSVYRPVTYFAAPQTAPPEVYLPLFIPPA